MALNTVDVSEPAALCGMNSMVSAEFGSRFRSGFGGGCSIVQYLWVE